MDELFPPETPSRSFVSFGGQDHKNDEQSLGPD